MRLSIKHNSNNLIEFDQLQINGREAVGGYAFSLSLTGNRSGYENPLKIFGIQLNISLYSPAKPIVYSIQSSKSIIQCYKSSNSEQVSFDVVLTKEQANTIEELRQEGDLKLNLELRALTISNGELLSSFDCADITVSRELWLTALKNAGFRQTLLFEIPLPATADELISLISKAQEFIEIGHYKDAVMQCRRIIERVETIRNDKQRAIDANKKSQNKQDRENMTSIERMLSIREHFKSVCHLGAHGNEEFTRTQAKTVLGMTMALLAEPTVGFLQ